MTAADSTDQRVRDQIVAGAARAAIESSLQKMTVADVASASGVSRATVYRHFEGGREEIVSALVRSEFQTFLGLVARAAEEATSLEEMLVRGLMTARGLADEHELLQRELSVEPEVVIPYLTVESRQVLDLIAGFFEVRLGPFGWPVDDIAAKSQYLARMFLSYVEASGSWDLADADQVTTLVRREFLGETHQHPVEQR